MAILTLQAAELVRFGKTHLLALHRFLASKPDNTRKAYQRGIQEFFELWNWKSPGEITVAEAAYFKKWLKSRDLSDSTICLRLAACQSYFEFLHVADNPFRLVTRKDCMPTPYDRSPPTAWLDFEKVLKAIPDDVAGRRDKALLIFFASTGRRRAEVAKLKVKDLRLTSNPKTYSLRNGNKVRTYRLSNVCHRAILDHWISANRLKTLTPESSVFGPINHGGALDPHRCLTINQVHRILTRNAQRAGLDPSKFRLRGLRHMFAGDSDRARLQAVHRVQSTTKIYTGKPPRGPASRGVQKQIDEIRQKASQEAEAALDLSRRSERGSARSLAWARR